MGLENGVYLGEFIKTENNLPKKIWQSCYLCSKQGQRICQFCGKVMCLDHYEVKLNSKQKWFVSCKECKSKRKKLLISEINGNLFC